MTSLFVAKLSASASKLIRNAPTFASMGIAAAVEPRHSTGHGHWRWRDPRRGLCRQASSEKAIDRKPAMPELWRLSKNGESLERDWTFKTFGDAWQFLSGVALLAEKHNHHPDWSNVRLSPPCLEWKTAYI